MCVCVCVCVTGTVGAAKGSALPLACSPEGHLVVEVFTDRERRDDVDRFPVPGGKGRGRLRVNRPPAQDITDVHYLRSCTQRIHAPSSRVPLGQDTLLRTARLQLQKCYQSVGSRLGFGRPLPLSALKLHRSCAPPRDKTWWCALIGSFTVACADGEFSFAAYVQYVPYAQQFRCSTLPLVPHIHPPPPHLSLFPSDLPSSHCR